MISRKSFAAAALCLLVLGGCDGRALRWEDPGTHTVRSGDTVYAIAFRYGLDYRDLAAWNGLSKSYLIRPGDVLRLTPPAARARAGGRSPGPRRPERPGSSPSSAREPAPKWRWPTQGQVVAGFADTEQNGVDIAGRIGQSIVAAAPGRVVYSGSGLIGYGQLIIIKHNNTYLSAYGHNDALLVTQGEAVEAGQRIARMGKGPGERPVLHFEIRLNGDPVDPLRHLPVR